MSIGFLLGIGCSLIWILYALSVWIYALRSNAEIVIFTGHTCHRTNPIFFHNDCRACQSELKRSFEDTFERLHGDGYD